MLFQDKLDGVSTMGLCLAAQAEIPHWPPSVRLLIPQFEINGYRIDWVYRDGVLLTFIECDGHDFHERTKIQAEATRSATGNYTGPWPRFFGSRVPRYSTDPFHCASQIDDFVNERHVPAEARVKRVTPIADMVERMLAESAPATAIIAAVRAMEASRCVT
jgi:hypothetical protein